ncbi:RIP metalloprotease RseP [soil metagenome]
MDFLYSALKFLFICLEVVLLFNLLIVVHELGHFLAARWRGLVVEKFAVWFGKPLWSKTINGVEYRLGSIPFGGFVAIPQLAPMETLEGKVEHDRSELPPVKPLDKIIVAFAGPLFSFGLAVVFACIVWVVGKPVSQGDISPVVGYVVKDGPAAKVGIMAGDKILTVDGREVTRFAPFGKARESVIWNVARSESNLIPITVDRNGEKLSFTVDATPPPQEGWGRRNLKQIMVLPVQIPLVASVQKDMPAEKAGLKGLDVILAANGQKLFHRAELAEILEASGTKPVTLTVQRGKEELQITMTPVMKEVDGKQIPRIGIQWDERGVTALGHPTPWEQVSGSVNTIFETLAAITTPKSGISLQHLSGPVGIMRMYYQLFEAPDGWRLALWFSVVFNVNLALLNLLPIPVLDGGHILLAIIEGIRRRPVNIKVLEFVQTACAMVIIGFMLYVTFYDVVDLPWKAKKGAEGATPDAMKAAPQPAAVPVR